MTVVNMVVFYSLLHFTPSKCLLLAVTVTVSVTVSFYV